MVGQRSRSQLEIVLPRERDVKLILHGYVSDRRLLTITDHTFHCTRFARSVRSQNRRRRPIRCEDGDTECICKCYFLLVRMVVNESTLG